VGIVLYFGARGRRRPAGRFEYSAAAAAGRAAPGQRSQRKGAGHTQRGRLTTDNHRRHHEHARMPSRCSLYTTMSRKLASSLTHSLGGRPGSPLACPRRLGALQAGGAGAAVLHAKRRRAERGRRTAFKLVHRRTRSAIWPSRAARRGPALVWLAAAATAPLIHL
jgi:hypothetical protein